MIEEIQQQVLNHCEGGSFDELVPLQRQMYCIEQLMPYTSFQKQRNY